MCSITNINNHYKKKKEKRNYRWYVSKLFSKINIYIRPLHPRESIVFAKKYFKNRLIDYAEIGIFEGLNAYYTLNSLNVKKSYLIDPYEEYSEYENDGTCKKVIMAKQKAYERLKNFRGINWIHKYSEDASDDIEDVDFIYIDGNHDYEYVKKDLEIYWNKVKPNGIMAGHDIDNIGVSRALIEFAKKLNLEIQFGNKTDWWIIKNL